MKKEFRKIYLLMAIIVFLIFMTVILKGILNFKPVKEVENIKIEEQSKEPILYSTLNFGEIPSILKPMDENSKGTTINIVSFSEDILGDANIVCMATVINTYKKDYEYTEYDDKFEVGGKLYCKQQTDVYEVRIDKIYYSEEKVEEGKIIKIETTNFLDSDCAPLNSQIMKDHQYIFPLRYIDGIAAFGIMNYAEGDIKPDGEFAIVYPFVNQIEVTKNNEYVFHGGWKDLIDENAIEVILDGEKNNDKEVPYMQQVKLRKDEGFESDLVSLIMKYKVEGANEEIISFLENLGCKTKIIKAVDESSMHRIQTEAESMNIYLYKNSQEMEEVAKLIGRDGRTIGYGLYDFQSKPHFYKKDNIIVSYIGDKKEITEKLETVLGQQFAGMK